MTTRSKYIVLSGFIIVLLIVGGFFLYSFMKKDDTSNVVEYTPEGEIAQNIEDPDITDSALSGTDTTVNNSDLADTLEPSEKMQEVIDEYKSDLNDSEVVNQLAQSYPSNLIPLYKAKSAADSSDIITDNGRPGWIAQYGSDALVPDIVDFYSQLLSSTNGFRVESNGGSQTVVGTVDNCYVQITVTPNNPERTGLNDQSNVDIYIERT